MALHCFDQKGILSFKEYQTKNKIYFCYKTNNKFPGQIKRYQKFFSQNIKHICFKYF